MQFKKTLISCIILAALTFGQALQATGATGAFSDDVEMEQKRLYMEGKGADDNDSSLDISPEACDDSPANDASHSGGLSHASGASSIPDISPAENPDVNPAEKHSGRTSIFDDGSQLNAKLEEIKNGKRSAIPKTKKIRHPLADIAVTQPPPLIGAIAPGSILKPIALAQDIVRPSMVTTKKTPAVTKNFSVAPTPAPTNAPQVQPNNIPTHAMPEAPKRRAQRRLRPSHTGFAPNNVITVPKKNGADPNADGIIENAFNELQAMQKDLAYVPKNAKDVLLEQVAQYKKMYCTHLIKKKLKENFDAVNAAPIDEDLRGKTTTRYLNPKHSANKT
jgi:hypothetical protein